MIATEQPSPSTACLTSLNLTESQLPNKIGESGVIEVGAAHNDYFGFSP
jgi:hypothetical protein